MLTSKLNTQHPQNSIDFFSELSKIIQNTSSESLTEANTNTNTSESSESSESSNVIICPSVSPSSDDNICLISKDKLHPNHITLKCNHKFNYIPIYKEVLYQKTKSNPILVKIIIEIPFPTQYSVIASPIHTEIIDPATTEIKDIKYIICLLITLQ
jgi:diphthamide synthase subunit DPH2